MPMRKGGASGKDLGFLIQETGDMLLGVVAANEPRSGAVEQSVGVDVALLFGRQAVMGCGAAFGGADFGDALLVLNDWPRHSTARWARKKGRTQLAQAREAMDLARRSALFSNAGEPGDRTPLLRTVPPRKRFACALRQSGVSLPRGRVGLEWEAFAVDPRSRERRFNRQSA